MISPALVIEQLFLANPNYGLVAKGTTPAADKFPMYIGKLPDIDDDGQVSAGMPGYANAVAIYDIPGWREDRLMSGEVIEKFGVQIKVRHVNYTDAYSKARDLAQFTDSVKNFAYQDPATNIIYKISNISRYTTLINSGNQTGRQSYEFFHYDVRITMKEDTTEAMADMLHTLVHETLPEDLLPV